MASRDARGWNRRALLKTAASAALGSSLVQLLPAYAVSEGSAGSPSSEIDLRIHRETLPVGERPGAVTCINGSLPGPLVRLREGETATLRVTNALDEDSSIHWHGLLVPPEMDGVPRVSFPGIRPGETFTYRYRVVQSGTYWYHSHSGLQEQTGVYGPLIIDPREPDPFDYERDYVVLLSDWTFKDPYALLHDLKSRPGYDNFQRRTLGDFARDIRTRGFRAAVADRREWAAMRMDPTDFADVTGASYTYLMNGVPSASNWSALFAAGERLRLRLINASAMTTFDIRIPGLSLEVVQADGQNVAPVRVDELRIAVAETYDVIVQPNEERPFTVFAETLDRSGYVRGTLTPRLGLEAPLPERRSRPLRTMADMGMAMEAGEHAGMSMDSPAVNERAAPPTGDHSAMATPTPQVRNGAMAGSADRTSGAMADHESMGAAPSPPPGEHAGHGAPPNAVPRPFRHGPDHHGPGNATVTEQPRSRLHEPGAGLENTGTRVLLYTDLRSTVPRPQREPDRELELHLTGNMERYMWSFDGVKYAEVKGPIPFRHGELLRLALVNDTMMEHPIHLHGMWMQLENGAGEWIPRKHTVNVKPAERLTVLVEADALGSWAFHCHLLFHMHMGMFRVVSVAPHEGDHG